MPKSLFAIAKKFDRELIKSAKLDHKKEKALMEEYPIIGDDLDDDESDLSREEEFNAIEDEEFYGFFDREKDIPYPVKILTPENKKKVDAYAKYLLEKQARKPLNFGDGDLLASDDDDDDFESTTVEDDFGFEDDDDIDADTRGAYIDMYDMPMGVSKEDYDKYSKDLDDDEDEDDFDVEEKAFAASMNYLTKMAKLSNKDVYEPEFDSLDDFDNLTKTDSDVVDRPALDFDSSDKFDLDAFDMGDDLDSELSEFDPETDEDILDADNSDGLFEDDDDDDDDLDI